MTAITYKITLGSTTVDTDSPTALISIVSQSALSVPINSCQITLLGRPKLSAGDAVKVAIGDEQASQTVFAGTIRSINYSYDQVKVEAVSSLRQLTVARFNLLFEKSTAGAIAKDLAKRSKLGVGKAEAGLKFPTYALGEQDTAYQHLQQLALQCGFDLFADRTDRLVFARYQPKTTHTVTYGVDILAYDWAEQAVAVTGVEVYGESPASQGQGGKGYSWLTKKEVKGKSGSSSGAVLRLVDPTARTQAIAAKVAKAVLTARQSQQQGWVKVLGMPAAAIDDRLSLAELPVSAHNGRYKITGVSHHLAQQFGFTTTLYWQEEP